MVISQSFTDSEALDFLAMNLRNVLHFHIIFIMINLVIPVDAATNKNLSSDTSLSCCLNCLFRYNSISHFI